MFQKLVCLFAFIAGSLCFSHSLAQEAEPEFIGDVFILDEDGKYLQADKEIAAFTTGISFRYNSYNATSLEIPGGKAQTRTSQKKNVRLIVRATDNNSDPLSIITIYHLKAGRKKRSTLLSVDNTGTIMKSRTSTKNILSFSGKKYGQASYLLILEELVPGEYGVIITNPNNRDEKRVVVSCFGVDKL